jgi:anti-sigma-K factor RskA
VDCAERRDSILLYAAGVLDAGECGGLREHLAGGCPTCAGYLAEAEATLAMLPLGLEAEEPSPLLRQVILNKVKSQTRSAAPSGWDRIVTSAAIAAVVAVAMTLLVVRQLWPSAHSPDDVRAISSLENQLSDVETRLVESQGQLDEVRKSLKGMQFAELTGPEQPDAVGRVFIDADMKKWYFFTCGMRPAADGKTYELWLLCGNQKIPAGTFEVSGGVGSLLGVIPQLPAGQTVSLAVTDEPMTGSKVPTGDFQMKGTVE